MIKTIIVDDENHCIQTLRYDLTKHCPNVDVVATASTGEEALSLINSLHPDLVFLDIEMPGMSGFELLSRLSPVNFDIIFVTAYDHYAIQAFRYAAVDYLLKPVVDSQLEEAVARVTANRGSPDDSGQLDALLHNLKDGLRSPRIALPTGRGIDFVNAEDILYCVADSNYTHVHMFEGKKYIIAKTLKTVHQLLESLEFFRIHQSYLINMQHVRRYMRDDGGYVVMSNDFRIPIAKRRKEEFMALLRKG